MYVNYIKPLGATLTSSLLSSNHDPDILNKGTDDRCGNMDGCLRTLSFSAVMKVKRCHGDEL